MSKVRCGIIGAGWWSTFAHLPALQNHPESEVVAVQKRDRAAAQKVADGFGVPNTCTSLEEVLEVGVDAVTIGSTPNVHYDQARQALEQGVHVLIEKPMTLRASEAQELVQLAAEKELHFVISCPWHYTRHGIEARKRILEGELGDIRLISILMTNYVEDLIRGQSSQDPHTGESYLEPNKSSYSDASVAGGGQIYTQVSHVAAYLPYLTGRRPASVFAEFENAGASMDLFDALTVSLEGGTLVSLASVGAPMKSERTYEVRIFGDEGMIYIELWKGTMAIHDRQENVIALEPLTEEEIYPHEAPARNLVDVILGNDENRSPASLGWSAMEIIEGACGSASSGEQIIIRHEC